LGGQCFHKESPFCVHIAVCSALNGSHQTEAWLREEREITLD
jgi:hypothetical protein